MPCVSVRIVRATRASKHHHLAFESQSSDLKSSTTTETEINTKEAVSDVDARVLRSMLQEKKLDLETEEDVRKLLERGTFKKVSEPKSDSRNEDLSEYSSEVLKTLANTKLWKKVSAQATDVLETVGIWVSNKVERDVKVLAALGLFAWDRAVRDVARSLPAAGAQAEKNLKQTNTSSFVPQSPDQPTKNALEQMNRPVDEIKSVSQELFGILSGERTSVATSSGRGLRTAAPAGLGNAAERQRRAYQQRQKLDKQQNDVTKIGGSVLDTAWELQRELKAETNIPGYKTEPIRNFIEASVVATGNILRAARVETLLSTGEKKGLRLQVPKKDIKRDLVMGQFGVQQAEFVNYIAKSKTESDGLEVEAAFETCAVVAEQARPNQEKEVLVLAELKAELKAERVRIIDRLSKCIEDPSDTWLTPSVIDSLGNLDFFSGSGMLDTLTKMILLKDEMQDPIFDQIATSKELAVGQLMTIRITIEDFCALTATEVSSIIADRLRVELLGQGQSSDKRPLILRLEEVMSELTKEGDVILVKAPIDNTMITEESAANQKQMAEIRAKATVLQPQIFDVIPDAVMKTQDDNFVTKKIIAIVHNEIGAAGAGLVAEIVSDDDFENAVGAAKVVLEVTGEEGEPEDTGENVFIRTTLRSLDVVFFVIERVVTVGVPSTVNIIKTVMTRVEEVNRNGKGSVGWKQVGNLANTKGRY